MWPYDNWLFSKHDLLVNAALKALDLEKILLGKQYIVDTEELREDGVRYTWSGESNRFTYHKSVKSFQIRESLFDLAKKMFAENFPDTPKPYRISYILDAKGPNVCAYATDNYTHSNIAIGIDYSNDPNKYYIGKTTIWYHRNTLFSCHLDSHQMWNLLKKYGSLSLLAPRQHLEILYIAQKHRV